MLKQIQEWLIFLGSLSNIQETYISQHPRRYQISIREYDPEIVFHDFIEKGGKLKLERNQTWKTQI